MITPVNLNICLQQDNLEQDIPEDLPIRETLDSYLDNSFLDADSFVEEIHNFVTSQIPARIFAITRISVYTKECVSNGWGGMRFRLLSRPKVKYSYKCLSDDYNEAIHTENKVLSNYLPINGEIPRDQILPLPKKKSIFSEWKTSLYIFRTAFFKIISNEIYHKPPTKLRQHAIACTVAVPALALMGILIPFAACYFNRIVGKLNLWMIDFYKECKTKQTNFTEASKRSFTPGLFADYIGSVNVSLNSGIPEEYLLQFVSDAIAQQKKEICKYSMNDRIVHQCDAEARTKELVQ